MSAEGFKNKVRLRVSGILRQEGKILLVKLRSPVHGKLLWMPPGGGVKFGERAADCLKREFLEETGLKINVQSFCFLNEMIRPPFHAVELYFTVQKIGGKLQLGCDPELPVEEQLLKDLQWVPIDQLDNMNVAPKQLLSIKQKPPTA